MRLYVASSWRNSEQPGVVDILRAVGHDVYDFRKPNSDNQGFHWSDIDPAWRDWSPEAFRVGLNHKIAIDGFASDFRAMEWADAFVLVLPCGRSAHLEAGWAVGQGKRTIILLRDGEPELMYKMATVCCTIDEVVAELDRG